MTKMFCDRCGAEISERHYSYLTHRIVFAKQQLFTSKVYKDWKDVNKYICPDCEEKYIHWFMNPEPPKEETC